MACMIPNLPCDAGEGANEGTHANPDKEQFLTRGRKPICQHVWVTTRNDEKSRNLPELARNCQKLQEMTRISKSLLGPPDYDTHNFQFPDDQLLLLVVAPAPCEKLAFAILEDV